MKELYKKYGTEDGDYYIYSDNLLKPGYHTRENLTFHQFDEYSAKLYNYKYLYCVKLPDDATVTNIMHGEWIATELFLYDPICLEDLLHYRLAHNRLCDLSYNPELFQLCIKLILSDIKKLPSDYNIIWNYC